MAVIDCLQIGDALPGNLKTMKVNIRGSSTLEVIGSRSLVSSLSNRMKKVAVALTGSGTMAEQMPTLNREDEASSTRVGPGKKYQI